MSSIILSDGQKRYSGGVILVRKVENVLDKEESKC